VAMVLLTFFLCFFILQGPIATSTSIYLHDGCFLFSYGCRHVDRDFEELLVIKMVGFSWIGCFQFGMDPPLHPTLSLLLVFNVINYIDNNISFCSMLGAVM